MRAYRSVATFSRPADNTAYTAGDAISNSGTQASVIPLTFYLPGPAGRITGCSCVVTPASSNLVITALDFNLMLFRPETNIPFTAASYVADNTAMAITAAAFREYVAKFSFVNSAWQNPAGGVTAGATGFQVVTPNGSRTFAPFDVKSIDSGASIGQTLLGVVQVVAAWTPLGVANQFDFALDVEVDTV